MNPTHLRARNFRTYEELDLDLPQGCVAIVGENGSGKSSLLQILDLALFGPASRSLADYLSEDAASTEMEIELIFDHAGETYRVRRHYSARGRGQTKLDLEQWKGSPEHSGDDTGPMWEPLTAENQKATQVVLERLLGLSRDTLHASAVLMQGASGAFTEAKPADRKRILADALGLATWEVLLDLARRDRRTTEKQVDELQGRIRMMEELAGDTAETEEALAVATARVSDTKTALADADATVEATSVEASRLEGAASVWQVRVAAVSAARARVDELERVKTDAASAMTESVTVRKELASLHPTGTIADLEAKEAELGATVETYRSALVEREQAQRAYEATLLRRNGFLGQANEANEKAAHLRMEASMLDARPLDDGARCDHCDQVLGVEAREQRIQKYEEDAVVLDARALVHEEAAARVTLPEIPEEPVRPSGAEDALGHVRKTLSQARLDQTRRASLEERLRGMQERAAASSLPEFVGELAAREAALGESSRLLAEVEEPEPGAADTAKAEALAARGRAEALRETLRVAEQNLARIEARLEQARKLADDLASDRAARDQAQARLDNLLELERAYGRDGIPTLIVEQAAIPSIEAEANRILGELGTSYRVELRTQAALKSGDGVKDTLDVVVIADVGERPYETFSGGERTRINLALRVALAELLATRRGSESRLLAIDEPEFLDEAGTMRLADVLRGLHQAGKFDRILLISHVPTLRDALDESLEVVKDTGRSRVIV